MILAIGINLLIQQRVVHTDVVPFQVILFGQLDIRHLRSQSHVELDLKLFLRVEIDRFLVRLGERFAHYAESVVTNILKEVLRREPIDFIGQHALAVHFTDHPHGGRALSKAGQCHLPAVQTQVLIHVLLVVLFFYCHCDDTADGVIARQRNIHTVLS